ncbi:hypothetical protein C0991_006464 [Blastosporella zonata]|nr:hypothetical protein C0991_006464 [Blastosporella zonata]
MDAAGPSHYIDLTLDDGLFPLTSKYSSTSRSFGKNIIELSDDSDTAASSSKPTRVEDLYWSDDEIMIVTTKRSHVVASSSKLDVLSHNASISQDDAFAHRLEQYGPEPTGPGLEDLEDEELARRLATEQSEYITQDELLARRLAEEDDAELSYLVISPEDEELARHLARQEEKSFNSLLKTIQSREVSVYWCTDLFAQQNSAPGGNFHWVVNYELEKRFEQARDKLQELMGEPSQELQLFHGTPATNIDSILKGGFRIGGVGGHPLSHGAALGCGIYLAADAATSIGYAAGGNKIFACRVIPGRITSNMMARPPPSIEPGKERFECYSANRVYVHRYSSLVLPCYMIEFDIPDYTNMWGAGMAGLGIARMGGTVLPRATTSAARKRPRTRAVATEEEAAVPSKRIKARSESSNVQREGGAGPATASRGKGKARQK